ncbi:hypothetical protein SAMN02910317_01144 [Ruminococcaceae bacterium FB2012]|nr:hypothetical protein SAMN02910317_01144 [Ruminococcaceae bacterium FB2012]
MTEKRTGLAGEYVRVDCGEVWKPDSTDDGLSYGGNQGWFGSGDGYISPLGCGLISCADILLYKSGRTRPGLEEYKEYVRSISGGRLKVRRRLGVNGISMALGMRSRLKKLGAPHKARWCFSKRKILPRIRDMLERDIPVTLSAGPQLLFGKRNRTGITLLTRDGQGGFILPGWRSGKVRDHYMTVTGLIETEERVLLEVSSWGEKYFIDWDDYLKYINTFGTFFSNIMYIK